MLIRNFVLGFVCSLVAFAAEPDVDRWPQFRGPGGLGLGSDKVSLPTTFGPGKAVLWKTDLPLGHGSPCIWGDRIFVTAFDGASKKPEVIALNRSNGKIVWRQSIPVSDVEKVHAVSSPATSTPVTDGEKIYVYSGSYGMLAYDWNGKLEWEHPMGVSKSLYGSGASPALVGDLVVITRDYPPDPFLLAIRKKDGKLAWKTDLTKSMQMGPKTAHSTPVIWKGQIVLNRPGEVSSYSQDGTKLWWFPTASGGTTSATAGEQVIYVSAFSMGADPAGAVKLPLFSVALEKYDKDKDGKLSAEEAPPDDLFFLKRVGVPDNVPGAHFTIKLFFRTLDRNKDGFIDESEYNPIRENGFGGRGGSIATGLIAVRPEGQGALPATALQWSEPRSVPEVSTPLEYRNRVYMVTAGGIVTCVEAQTGKVIYRGRVNAPGAYYASPVAAGGKVFVASAEGVVSVLGAGETLEVLANNDLGEPVYGTPAPVGSALYIRSANHLWAFGGK